MNIGSLSTTLQLDPFISPCSLGVLTFFCTNLETDTLGRMLKTVVTKRFFEYNYLA